MTILSYYNSQFVCYFGFFWVRFFFGLLFFFFFGLFASFLSFFNLFISSFFGRVAPPWRLGLKGSNFYALMGSPLDNYNSQFVCLLANSSQTIKLERLKILGFSGSHCGMLVRKMDEDQSRTLPIGVLFFSSKFPGGGHNSMPE